MRSLLKSHPKVPLEFLYLETGCLPIKYIISSRRTNFLKTILSRDDEELTKRILREQQCHPSPGDFVKLIKDDFDVCDLTYNEDIIIMSGKEQFKKMINTNLKRAAFKVLLAKQQGHSKVRDIKYEKFEVQPYLTSREFSNDDASLLAALRSHTVRGIRCNIKTLYRNKTQCPLKCSPSSPQQDTQEHLLVCSKLVLNNVLACHNITHNDIYGDIEKQKMAVSVFKEIINKRNKLLDEKTQNTADLPVGNHWTLAHPSAV